MLEKAFRYSLQHAYKVADSEAEFCSSVAEDNWDLKVVGIAQGSGTSHYRVACGKKLFFGQLNTVGAAFSYLFSVLACH